MGRAFIETREDLWNVAFTFLFIVAFLVLVWILSGDLPHYIDLFDFSLIVLSTHRLIRLIVYDKITRFVREYFADSAHPFKRTVHELLVCNWCVGIWAALASVALYYLVPGGWLFLLILAISGLASFIQIVTNAIIRYTEKSSVEK